jgi:hypothetical protein
MVVAESWSCLDVCPELGVRQSALDMISRTGRPLVLGGVKRVKSPLVKSQLMKGDSGRDFESRHSSL